MACVGRPSKEDIAGGIYRGAAGQRPARSRIRVDAYRIESLSGIMGGRDQKRFLMIEANVNVRSADGEHGFVGLFATLSCDGEGPCAPKVQ